MSKREMLSHIKIETDRIESCPPFPELESGRLPRDGAQSVFEQYYWITFEFPKLLCEIGARLKSDSARSGVISNLWDEHGRGNLHNSHRAMFERFFKSYLGHGPPGADPSWQTRLYINGVNGICVRGSISEAVGCLVFSEAATPGQYRSLLSWLRKNTDLRDENLGFWIDHIEHDGDHCRQLLDITLAGENVSESEVMMGVTQARYLEEVFWRQFIL